MSEFERGRRSAIEDLRDRLEEYGEDLELTYGEDDECVRFLQNNVMTIIEQVLEDEG